MGEAFEKRYVEMLQQSEAKEFRKFVGSLSSGGIRTADPVLPLHARGMDEEDEGQEVQSQDHHAADAFFI